MNPLRLAAIELLRALILTGAIHSHGDEGLDTELLADAIEMALNKTMSQAVTIAGHMVDTAAEGRVEG